MRRETGNEAVDFQRRPEGPPPSRPPDIEADRIRLAGAEAEQVLAMLYGDLCAARHAAARIKAIKARLAAASEDCR
jgi:hypothetical protein